jgi:hypothetical protein
MKNRQLIIDDEPDRCEGVSGFWDAWSDRASGHGQKGNKPP